MYFHHRLQQELDNFWMKVATYQYLRGRSNELHVIGWNVSVNINHTLWQYQASELRVNTGESLRHRQTHYANVRILEQRFNGRRIRRADDPYSIQPAIINCLNCSGSCERQKRSGFRIHSAFTKNLFS